MDEKFAEAFKAARQAAGISQAEVAARMADYGYEISQPVIGKIERGERRVSIGEGEALSFIVGRSIRTLLEGPSALRVDLGLDFLRARRADLKEAIERFEMAQVALAQAIDSDDSTHPSSRFARAQGDDLLSETPRDVFAEYEKDTRAAREAYRLRDQMDEGAEDYDDRDLLTEEGSPRLFRLLEMYGDTIDTLGSARGVDEAWQAMRGSVEVEEVGDAQAADPAE